MEWWQWLIAISGVLASVRLLWMFVEEIVDARRAYPILMEIAEHFRPNGGNSLHDHINQISDRQLAQSVRLDDISRQLETLIIDQQ